MQNGRIPKQKPRRSIGMPDPSGYQGMQGGPNADLVMNLLRAAKGKGYGNFGFGQQVGDVGINANVGRSPWGNQVNNIGANMPIFGGNVSASYQPQGGHNRDGMFKMNYSRRI